MFLGIRETCMPLKASMLLLPLPLDVTLTLSVHFSNFDSPLTQTSARSHLKNSRAFLKHDRCSTFIWWNEWKRHTILLCFINRSSLTYKKNRKSMYRPLTLGMTNEMVVLYDAMNIRSVSEEWLNLPVPSRSTLRSRSVYRRFRSIFTEIRDRKMKSSQCDFIGTKCHG